MAETLHVVATAGHVDHGKSSLIQRLTGRDPDRWEEEKRRGLTLDLGFAWATLPSGMEVGFVDVPGHERFVRTMLAGVGPVRLVLFVVAADEGWKPQSEEHLEIVDVLGAEGAVVALSKRDLVDAETLELREVEVRDRLAGTTLEGAPVVACSARTDEGLDALRDALDAMVAEAPNPRDDGRPRLFVDRSFTIKGAGTVVTGTLTGGTLGVGDEVQLHPSGIRARLRSLQTHERPVDVARPVSRVAANLVGVDRDAVERGDALTRPGQWRASDLLEARLTGVRGLESPLAGRGAFKLHTGAAERDALVRILGDGKIAAGETVYARIRLSAPVAAEVGDRFVLRETGRRATVAGGSVLDLDPPRRPGADAEERLRRRAEAERTDLPALLVRERLAVRAADVPGLSGSDPSRIDGALRLGPWWVSTDAYERLSGALRETLATHHREHPLLPGVEWAEARRVLPDAEPRLRAALEHDLAAALLHRLEEEGLVAREGTLVRLAGHAVSLGEREEEAARLVRAVEEAEPTPPDAAALRDAGFGGELVDAAVRMRRLTRISRELVCTPGFVGRADAVARELAATPEGLTVSAFRKELGTTRKYALPLLEHFDRAGVTRRDGDVRRPA